MVIGLVSSAALGLGAGQLPGQDGEWQVPKAMAEQVHAEYADCVVGSRNYKKPVASFLRQIPLTQPWVAAALKAADPTCLSESVRRTHRSISMKIAPPSFRDALYPALYRQRFARAPQVARIGTLPPLSFRSEFDGDISTLPAEYRPCRALGDCVARAQPVAVHSMLLAVPSTKQEDAAIEALKPAIAACLPAGVTLRMNRAALRAYTGEAMFKLSEAAMAAPIG